MPKKLNQASNAAIHRSKVAQLNNIGIGNDVGEFIKSEGQTVIEQLLGEFIERVHQNINQQKDMVTTGAISDITLQAGDNVINVVANPHLIFQSRGVNGWKVKKYDTPHSYVKDKRPPIQPFIDWVKAKQLFLTDKNDNHRKYDKTDNGKERPFKELTDDQKITQAAWAISTKVHQEGFKGRDLYEKEIPKLVSDLQDQLADFALQQINQSIDINPRGGGKNRIIIK
jgi:hypothetical protein